MLQDPLSHFGLWASARVYDGVSTNYGIRFRKLRYSHQAIRSGQMKFILIPVRKSLAISCEHMAPQTEPIVFIIWVWKSVHRFCVSYCAGRLRQLNVFINDCGVLISLETPTRRWWDCLGNSTPWTSCGTRFHGRAVTLSVSTCRTCVVLPLLMWRHG